MDFLKAVYGHLKEIGLYNTDWVDRMCWRLFVVFVLVMLTTSANADGLYVELGIGVDKELSSGRNPASVIRLRYEKEHGYWFLPNVVEFNHHSSIPDGPPFNGNREDTVDQFSLIWRYKFL